MKNTNSISLKKQKGMSILEIALVIVLIATMAIIAQRVTDNMSGRARVGEAVTQVQMIVSAVNEWAPRSGIYSDVDIDDLATLGFLAMPRDPATGEQVSTEEMNPWEGGITVVTGSHPTTFVIEFTGINRPSEASQLAARLRQMGTAVTDTGSTVGVTIGDTIGGTAGAGG